MISVLFKIIANELFASDSYFVAEGNRLNRNFPRVSTVVSGLGRWAEGSGKYTTYISFLPLFFMEINRTLPRSRHVACAMRPSHFEAIPEVALLMTSWG